MEVEGGGPRGLYPLALRVASEGGALSVPPERAVAPRRQRDSAAAPAARTHADPWKDTDTRSKDTDTSSDTQTELKPGCPHPRTPQRLSVPALVSAPAQPAGRWSMLQAAQPAGRLPDVAR